jgi:hypothetical protein
MMENDELQSIWKEVVAACMKVLSQNLLVYIVRYLEKPEYPRFELQNVW